MAARTCPARRCSTWALSRCCARRKAIKSSIALTHSARPRHMKTLFLILVCSTLLTCGGVAYAQVNQSDPQALIETATQQVLDEVRIRAVEPSDIPRIMGIVNKSILPYTDLRRTTQLAMGRHWKTATPAQQEQVTEQFK